MSNSSHLSGPLRVGPVSPAGEPSAQGTALLVQDIQMDITDAVDVQAFRLPRGSSIVGLDVVVETASDAGTTGTLKLTSDAGDIVTDFDVTAVGLLSVQAGDATIADVGRMLDPAPTATKTLSLEYEETGDGATEGVFTVRLMYIQGSDTV